MAEDTETRTSDGEQFDPAAIASRGAPKLDATPETKGDYVAARWAVQDDHYRGLHQTWVKVLYFLVGKHWIRWNDTSTSWEPDADVPAWRQQPVTNYIYAFFRTARAKMTKNRPTLEVVPPSGDSEDREAASLAQALLEFFWRYLQTPQKVKLAIGWFITTGNVFFNVDWDENAGKLKPRTVLVEVPDPDNAGQTTDVECPCDDQGEPYRRESTGPNDLAIDGQAPYDLEREPDVDPEGEIEITIDDPFSTRFNPEATSPEDAEEWMVGKLRTTQYVVDTFNVKAADLTKTSYGSGEDRVELEDAISRVAASAPDPYHNRMQGVSGSDQADAIGDRHLVIHYYRKGNAKAGYPRGRHWITAGRVKVWPPANDTNYPNGEAELPNGFWPPRVPMVDTPIPGQPQGIGMLTQVVPLNEALDHLDGKILEHDRTMAMGGIWFVAPADKNIIITSEPGQVKVSKAMGEKGREAAPFQATMTPLPAQVYAEREVLGAKMRTIAGLSDVDMSQQPEGVTAGRAFLVLQEASSEAISTAIQALEESIQEIGRRELVIVQEKYDEPRTIKIKGDEGQWQFRSFSRIDLKDGMEVRVQAGSAFPWSKSAQFDTKLSMLQLAPGLFTNPTTGEVDEQKLSRLMDAGGSGMAIFTSDEDPDKVEFNREVAMFDVYDPIGRTGQPSTNELPMLGMWMNIPVKQKLAYDFMKRSFSRFKRWTPEAQTAWINWLQQLTVGVQQMVDAMTPAEPAGAGAAGGAAGGAPSGGAPAQGGGGAAVTPPGGEVGRSNTPGMNRGPSKLQLTKGDYRAAGAA